MEFICSGPISVFLKPNPDPGVDPYRSGTMAASLLQDPLEFESGPPLGPLMWVPIFSAPIMYAPANPLAGIGTFFTAPFRDFWHGSAL